MREGGQIEVCQVLHDVSPDAGQGRIRDGRISEEWAADDIATIMNQLGAFSPPWLG